MQKRKGIFSAGTKTKTQAVRSGNTEMQLSGLAMFLMGLCNCGAVLPSRAERAGPVPLC